MVLKNKLVVNIPNFNMDIDKIMKMKIAEELNTTVESIGFKDIPLGFEFVWDKDLKGNIRITHDNTGDGYIIIESENSWDAVECYNSFFQWMDELEIEWNLPF